MEHIEEAGIHSGDSSCALPPITLGRETIDRIRTSTEAIAKGVGVRRLLNVQYAMVSDVVYVLEANPRASRTVPFVSKATATPLAKAAARVMLGESIASLRSIGLLPAHGDGGDLPPDAPIAVKEAVMPFNRFKTLDGKTVDAVLGPEMRSTAGTAEVLRRNGVDATVVRKHSEGAGADGEPTIVGRILSGEVKLVVNTPHGATAGGSPRLDGYEIRTAAIRTNIPCITTVQGIGAARAGDIGVRSLQDWHPLVEPVVPEPGR